MSNEIPPRDPSALSQELDAVSRREANFRLKTVQDFLVLEKRLREQAKKIDALNDELGARNTYIHELHLKTDELLKVIQSRHHDVERMTAWLAQAEDDRTDARNRLQRIKASVGWWLAAPFVALQDCLSPRRKTPRPDLLPTGGFAYFLHTSPFRVYREASFTFRGWALPNDSRAITALRARVDDREFAGRYGLPEPDVVRERGLQPANPQPGFDVTVEIPVGRSWLRLEACLENREWRAILNTPVWREN